MISKIESTLKHLAKDRGASSAKARAKTEILRWAISRGPKPNLQPPERLARSGGILTSESDATQGRRDRPQLTPLSYCTLRLEGAGTVEPVAGG